MGRRQYILVVIAFVLATLLFVTPYHAPVRAAGALFAPEPQRGGSATHPLPTLAQRTSDLRRPGPTIEPYIRPEFAIEMHTLRPFILAAARRHNNPAQSGMSDHDFAVVIAMLLYNENFGAFEERVVPLRALRPLYEDIQTGANEIGANLSVWPANLRPSVALEILQNRVPLPNATGSITFSTTIVGSRIKPSTYTSQYELYIALTNEISQPRMAVEYLAANLERGVYRAQYEDVPVTWRALAAWHNQGIVAWHDIRTNATASSYVHRTSSYLPAARTLIDTPTDCRFLHCRIPDAGIPDGD